MIFNWKITAVPTWNCLLCLLAVCSGAAARTSQGFLLVLFHHCCPVAATRVRGDGAGAPAASQDVQKLFWLTFLKLLCLLHSISVNYTTKWMFFSSSLKWFFNTWIWNLIWHLLHHVLPDFSLSPCPSTLCLMMCFIFKTAWLCQPFSEGAMKWLCKCSHIHSFGQCWRAIMWHRIQV